jgi:hypothetical protein
MKMRPMVGLAVLAGAVWLIGAGRADEGIYVRALDPDEAEARKVGVCDWFCSTLTLPCYRPASMKDWCANANLVTTPPQKKYCDSGTRLGGCYACSIGANFTICDRKKGANCTADAAPGQVCGFMKMSACSWTGTKCVCPGLPARYSTDPCKDNNCK